jgi:hypothetical protein
MTLALLGSDDGGWNSASPCIPDCYWRSPLFSQTPVVDDRAVIRPRDGSPSLSTMSFLLTLEARIGETGIGKRTTP